MEFPTLCYVDKWILCLQAANDVQEDDDEFEAYRKRMMLGYKHRYVVPAGLRCRMLSF